MKMENVDPIIQKVLDVTPFIRLILGEECVFTISNTTNHLHVDQGSRLKLPIKDGVEIKEGSATYGCITTGKAASYKVDAKVYGVAYIGKAFPIRNSSGKMVGSINLGIPIDTQEKIVQSAGTLETSIQKINEITDGLTNSSGALTDSIQKLMDATSNVESSIKKIFTIVNLLKDISINTKVLGLNAAIQSAHIGNAGSGFGVISREIRTLAEKARNSVTQIDKNIKGILESIDQFSLEAKELSKISNVQVDFTGKIASNINNLSDMSKNLLKIAENLISN